MTAPRGESSDLKGRLISYCIAKKYQLRADAWLGFGAVGEREAFQAYVLNLEPWAEDTESAALVEEMGLMEGIPKTLKEAKAVAQRRARENKRQTGSRRDN